ncbi:unknown [Clostridium sp. CAG:440]|nr:unknown [Clostridium sp. CAG:440]
MKEKGKKKLVILYSIIIILIIAIIIMLSVILKTYKIKNESISSKNEVIKLFVNKYVEEKYLNHDLLKIFIIYDNEEHKNSNEIKMQYVLAYTMNQNKKTNVQMEEIKKEYKDIFGEVSDIDFSILERYKPYYKYNIEKEKVEIKDFEEDNTYEKYNYKILDVQNEENIYKINMELIKQNLVEKNEEKMANATLTLKTEGNDVYLVDYNEYN